MRAAATALLTVWVAASIELLIVLLLHRAELTGAWEAGMGAALLSPTALLVSAPVALLSALVHTALLGRARSQRILATAIAALAAAFVAALVATGRHFAGDGRRAAFAAVIGLAVAATAWAAQPTLAAALRRAPRGFALGAALLGVACELANRFVLVRLYPPFHSALGALALSLWAIGGLSFLAFVPLPASPARRAAPAAFAALMLVAATVFARKSAAALGRFDNFRLLVVDHAPILSDAVRVAAVLSPPPPLVALDPCEADPASCVAHPPGGPSFVGRDILLVSIDALRADHVGAYGYGRPTTPRIDALSRQAVVFDRAYCPTPHTSYSVTSMMTGKYMRPLLLQGAGQDSETLATFLRTYGYKTAAFYPPAVFFIDQARFEPFERSHLGFEYRKVEFLEGEGRVGQVDAYLAKRRPGERVFLWLHLFGPHEPYEAHPEHPFGDRDVDRYDSEIAAADATAGDIVEHVRRARPDTVVILTADHGEEFGEHGGRYHGTTVYEEQVRVPLLISAPGLLEPHHVGSVTQTIDILPTLLAGLSIPPSPRIRGRSFGPALIHAGASPGLAFAETDESALLAEGDDRLVCARRLGACRLFDVGKDPGEREDLGPSRRDRFDKMRGELQALGASHGRFERDGLRAETGRGWPPAVLRGIAGDADAAPDLAALLDDSDREIRRKAAELLYSLRRPETAAALTLALGRDEDTVVRRWCALALTRVGQTAPLGSDLLVDPDPAWRRRAALALAEAGDVHAGPVLVEYWQHGGRDDHDRALEILEALGHIRFKDAVWPLVQGLGDVRLRPRIAETLAAIGDGAARGPLVAALGVERFQTARIAIADALVSLGAREELARPLIRFLGVPDPLPGGVGYAVRAGILTHVGGPDSKALARLSAQSNVGVRLQVVVPKGLPGAAGLRVVVRARADDAPGQVRLGRSQEPLQLDRKGVPTKQREAPRIHDRDYVALTIPASKTAVEVFADLPASLAVPPGHSLELVLFAERHVHVEGLAVVPLAPELPPPPPEPWTPSDGDDTR